MFSFLLSCLLYSPLSMAYSPKEAHPHKGILKPIVRAPKAVSLNAKDLTRLKEGKLVIKQQSNSDGSGGTGVAVQYIKASPAKIWSVILNYPQYKNWVDNVKSATVYKKEGKVLSVEMLSKISLVTVGIYTKNYVNKDQGYMSWTLDYDRKSDVDDTVGYWRLEAVSANPPVTKVEYSSQMKVKSLPKFVANYLVKEALVSGTKWVKTQSEK